ncbi:MAG: BaiN/RdsA family NAD(P)/FAD-dependent oxidoreductase [Candidatus Geothermincolia bacterium]
MSDDRVQVIVVGAGPAGLTAAGEAAGAGAGVTLLDGEERPGKKLLLTGKGRCNLSNTLPLERFLEGFGANGVFLRNACHRFFSSELREFLAGIGVETAVERGGRIYPASGGAAAVLAALLAWVEKRDVRLLTRRRVTRVSREPDGRFLVAGDGFAEHADRVVLAVGGASYPQTGSRGDGYRIAAALGHRIVAPRPALVPVVCREKFFKDLAGLKLRNVRLVARPPGHPAIESFGEVHATPFGISGPAVFPVSARIGALAAAAPVPLLINLKPALDAGTLEARVEREMTSLASRTTAAALATLLPRQLVPVFLEVAGLDGALAAVKAGRAARVRIRELLQAFPCTATGTLPIAHGMATAGGVDLREVHPVTLGSRLVPGLFFAGEVLDLDGDTGGYNLQAAFTTGHLAGRAAAA